MKKNQKSTFSKSLNYFRSKHRRAIRLTCERTIGTVKATMMSFGLFGFVIGTPGAALAANLPTGGQVISGNVNMQSTTDALRILQGSQSAIVNWESFDIGAGALVDIIQPNIDAAMLSRVVGGDPSQIMGTLNATGHLYLINPNGILFGKDSTVNVHALIASTLDIADSAFLSGNISFQGDSEAAVMNLGTINAKDFAALIAGDVDNQGSISVPGGDAALLSADAVIEVGDASGGKITLDLSGLLGGSTTNSGSMDVASLTTQGGSATILGEQVSVSGSVDASGATGGGSILIGGDFQGKNSAISNAQNLEVAGVISSDASLDGDGGSIILWADGDTQFSGSITARGAGQGVGGFAEVSGKDNLVFSGSADLSGPNGGGELLLDPTDITITYVGSSSTLAAAGDANGNNNLESGENAGVAVTIQPGALTAILHTGTDVTLQATNDITVDGAVAKTAGGNAVLTLVAGNDINVNQTIVGGVGQLGVVLNATGNVTVGNVIQTNGGVFTSTGVNFTQNAAILTNGATHGDVTINHTGTVAINDNIGTSGSLSGEVGVTAGSTITLNGDVYSNNENITFNQPITLGKTVQVNTNTGAGNIVFGGTIDAAYGLTANAGTGSVTFAGDIGAATGLTGLTVVGTNVAFDDIGDAGTVGVAGATNVTDSGTTTFNGTIYKSNSQAYNATTAHSIAGGGAPVAYTSSGDVVFSGGNIALSNGANLSVTSSGGVITTTAIQGTSDEDVTLNANGTLSVGAIGNGTGVNDVSLTGATVNLSGNITTSDDATDNGLVTINGNAFAKTNLLIDTSDGGGVITFSNSIDADGSARSLSLNAGAGNIDFDGAAGGADPFSSLSITNAANVTFDSTVATDGTLTQAAGTGTTTFTGAANAASYDVTATAGIVTSNTLTATGGGTISLSSDELNFGGGANSIIGTGTLTLKQATAAATVGVGSGAGLTLDLTDADILAVKDGFSSITIGDGASGNVIVDGATFLDNLTISSGADLTIQTAALSTTGSIALSADGNVVANHSVIATTTNTITADVDNSGAGNITINAGSGGTNGIRGTSVTLSSGGTATDVTVSDDFDNTAGSIVFADALNQITLNADVVSDGDIDFGNNTVVVGAGVTVNADKAGANPVRNITLGDVGESAATITLAGNNLTLDAGTGIVKIYASTTSGGGIILADANELHLTGGTVTVGNQIDDDAGELLNGLATGNSIKIAANSVLANSTGSLIDLTGFNIDGTGANGTLTINSTNDAITLAQVGQGTPIAGLTVNAGDSSSAISLTADISASGNVEFQNTSKLDFAASVDITTTGTSDIIASTGITAIDFSDNAAGTNILTSGQDITFATALTDSANGPGTITLAPARSLTLSGATLNGSSNPILDIDIGTSGTGTLAFNTGSVTAGTIDIDGAGSDDTVDINQNLTASAGVLDIDGVSAINIDASGARTLTASAAAIGLNTASADIVIDNGTSAVTIENTGGDAAVVISKNITAAGENALNINSTGNITVAGIDLYNATAGGNLAMNVDSNNGANGVITLNGNIEVGSVDLNGGTTANSITIPAAITITSKSGAVEMKDGSDIATINLTGANTTVSILNHDASDSAITLPNVAGDSVSASSEPSLTLTGTGSITVGNVDLNNGGGATGGSLAVTLDTDNDSTSSLTSGTLTLGGFSISGGTDNNEDFSSSGLTTYNASSNIVLDQLGTVTFTGDIVSAGSITASNINTKIDLGNNVDLTASSGSITSNSGVTLINLSGTGTNKLHATGDINLAAVGDTANVTELEIQGER